MNETVLWYLLALALGCLAVWPTPFPFLWRHIVATWRRNPLLNQHHMRNATANQPTPREEARAEGRLNVPELNLNDVFLQQWVENNTVTGRVFNGVGVDPATGPDSAAVFRRGIDASFEQMERDITAALARDVATSAARDLERLMLGREVDRQSFFGRMFGRSFTRNFASLRSPEVPRTERQDMVSSSLAKSAGVTTTEAARSLQAFGQIFRNDRQVVFLDTENSFGPSFFADGGVVNRPQPKSKIPPPHKDAGKVIARPVRTFAGVRVEDVRQADGSVARRLAKPSTKSET